MSILKRITIKLIALNLIIFLILALFIPSQNFASDGNAENNESTNMTEDELRDGFVNSIIEFYNQHRNQCSYDFSFGPGRERTYRNGPDSGSYCFDCVGWVSCAFHWFLGLGGKDFTYFVDPTTSKEYSKDDDRNFIDDPTHFERVNNISQAKKGDVLVAIDQHVAIYIGDGQVLDMYEREGLGIRSINGTYTWDFVAHLYNFEGVTFNPIEGGSDISGSGSWDTEEVDLDEIAEDFNFQGMPTTVIREDEKVDVFRWIFDGIGGFLDYLTGSLITIVLKGPILGFTEVIQSTISSLIGGLNKADNKAEEGIIYTIEDVIFNKIPIFDVNVFSNTAGGENIEKGSAIQIIRNSIATWYVAFRNLVVISLSVILIYIGIRMALSTIPQGKAKYKKMLIGWLQALIIVLVVHYIMVLTLNINDSLVNLLNNSLVNSMQQQGLAEESIYDTIKTRAYDFRLSVGLPATIIYLVLVILWIRFLWVYAKRSFTILILIIIAPFIGAKYAFDSARGKKGTSFSSWLYDFVYNVLIQTVHAIVYTALMTAVISFAFDSVVGYIIALVIMNFILDADEIFRNIFNFSGKSSLSSETAKQEGYKDVLKNFAGAVFVGEVASGMYGLATGTGKFISNGVKGIYKDMGKYTPGAKQSIQNKLNSIDNKIISVVPASSISKEEETSLLATPKKLFNRINYKAKARVLAREKGIVGIKGKQLKSSLNKHLKKRYTSNFKLIKDTLTGTGSVILAVPMTVVNTKAGAGLMTLGIKKLQGISRETYFKTSGGEVQKQNAISYNTDKYTKKRDKYYKSIDDLITIKRKENEIQEEFNTVKTNTNEEKDIQGFKEAASSIILEASSTKINAIIEEYIDTNDISTIDNSTVNDIIDKVIEELGLKISLSQSNKNIIASKAKSKILKKNEEERRNNRENVDNQAEIEHIEFTKDDVVNAVQYGLVNTTVKKEFREITNDLISLDNTVKRFEKNAKTKYRKTNKFIENL